MRAIIGLGNAFRGDDAVGLFVAEQLEGLSSAELTVLCHEGEPLDLLELWSGFDEVTLIEASRLGIEEGTLMTYDLLGQDFKATAQDASSHAFSLTNALKLGKTLDRFPAKLWLYPIEGSSFQLGSELSLSVKESAQTLIRILSQYESQSTKASL